MTFVGVVALVIVAVDCSVTHAMCLFLHSPSSYYHTGHQAGRKATMTKIMIKFQENLHFPQNVLKISILTTNTRLEIKKIQIFSRNFSQCTHGHVNMCDDATSLNLATELCIILTQSSAAM